MPYLTCTNGFCNPNYFCVNIKPFHRFFKWKHIEFTHAVHFPKIFSETNSNTEGTIKFDSEIRR